MNDKDKWVIGKRHNITEWEYAYDTLLHGLNGYNEYLYAGQLDAGESGAVLDFIVELVKEIERLQVELIDGAGG